MGKHGNSPDIVKPNSAKLGGPWPAEFSKPIFPSVKMWIITILYLKGTGRMKWDKH